MLPIAVYAVVMMLTLAVLGYRGFNPHDAALLAFFWPVALAVLAAGAVGHLPRAVYARVRARRRK